MLVPVLFIGGSWLAYTYALGGSGGSGSSTNNAAPVSSGSFTATGGKLGKWQMKVSGCKSGKKYGFSGVILFDAEDRSRHVRLIRRSGGRTDILVQVKRGSKPVRVRKCKTADVRIAKTGTSINFVSELRGSATLKCANLSGSANFPSCH